MDRPPTGTPIQASILATLQTPIESATPHLGARIHVGPDYGPHHLGLELGFAWSHGGFGDRQVPLMIGIAPSLSNHWAGR